MVPYNEEQYERLLKFNKWFSKPRGDEAFFILIPTLLLSLIIGIPFVFLIGLKNNDSMCIIIFLSLIATIYINMYYLIWDAEFNSQKKNIIELLSNYGYDRLANQYKCYNYPGEL